MQILIPVFIIIIILFFVLKKGKLSFRKLVSKNPDKAFALFSNDDSWLVDINMDMNINKDTWDGPFRLYVPCIGKTIKVYGKIDNYEKSQKEILEQLKI